ncbi:hypothetical protein L838_0417 [Mycobacterium avium MAV_120709_2344]|nr:hypothetical protein L838_0417 [Mycobacterium avium MAV_120709_2344]
MVAHGAAAGVDLGEFAAEIGQSATGPSAKCAASTTINLLRCRNSS